MNNTYLIHRNDLIELLTNIDNFESKIEHFKEKHSKYNYSIKIEKNDKDEEFQWTASINIKTRDGIDNIETT